MTASNASIKANRTSICSASNAAPGYGHLAYMTRRRLDYVVRYLAGTFPPNEYQMKQFAAAQGLVKQVGPQAEETAENIDDDPEP